MLEYPKLGFSVLLAPMETLTEPHLRTNAAPASGDRLNRAAFMLTVIILMHFELSFAKLA